MDIRPLNAGLPLAEANSGSDAASIADAARQLESQFAKMMIGMMRETALGDSMFPGAAGQFRDLYDRELANVMTRGEGLGLQPMIRAQLSKTSPTSPQGAAKAYSLSGYSRTPALDALREPMPLPISKPTVQPGHPQSLPLPKANQPSPQSTRTPSLDKSPATAYANSVPGTPEAFVAELWPHAQRAAAELGVSPKALLAQAALETGWGRHMARHSDGRLANNLFGIKAGGRWGGDAMAAATREVIGGQNVVERAEFRAYDSAAASFSDYVELLKSSPRYADAVGQQDPAAFARALQTGGYATDPRYAAKIAAIANGPTLNRALAALDGEAVRNA